MADNTQLNAGTGGNLMASDEVGGVHFARVKVAVGPDGTAADVTETNPLFVHQALTGTVHTPLRKFLVDTVTGLKNLNDAGGFSAVLTPASGVVYRLTRLIISMESTAGMRWDEYGDITSGLSTGIALDTYDTVGATVIHDLLDGVPVKTNAGWGEHCYNTNLLTAGAGTDFFHAEWDFEHGEEPIRLDGTLNQQLRAVCADDFSNLTNHYIKVEGYIE